MYLARSGEFISLPSIGRKGLSSSGTERPRFTKSDDYVFNLDPIRIPQKYPGKKQFKGPRQGQYSCNPLGNNPGDVWVIPNVKNNHVEKTTHHCQFPIELIERLVLSLTNPSGLVVDPYIGAGSAACAAVMHERRAAGADLSEEYLEIAKGRIQQAIAGTLPARPRGKQVYIPSERDSVARRPEHFGPLNEVVTSLSDIYVEL
jgi:adenine-specific DNA-methyltransferase